MTNELYERIMMKASNINVNSNSELEMGRFQGMVDAYNLISENRIDYIIENDKILRINTNNFIYLWNSDRKAFDYRAR